MKIVAHPNTVVAAEVFLAEQAEVIRVLGRQTIANIIEIGRRLSECRERLPHGDWLPWLEAEFGWSEDTAGRFINVHALASKSRNLQDLNVPASALYLLAAPSTPPAAVEAVAEAAAQSEDGRVSLAEVQRLIVEATAKQRAEDAERYRAEIEAKEQEVRAELGGKLIVEPGEIEAEINKQIAPIRARLEKAEAARKAAEDRLAAAKQRHRGRNDKNPKEQVPPTGPTINFDANQKISGLKLGLEFLTDRLTIAPEEFVRVETEAAAITGEDVAHRLLKVTANAQAAHYWLSSLLDELTKKGIANVHN